MQARFNASYPANVRNGAALRCLEAVGQAISYGMNTQTKANPLIGFCVTFGLMAASLAPMIILVSSTPDRIPAEVILEGQEEEQKAKVADIETKVYGLYGYILYNPDMRR
ncbi:hypothetical protein DL769_005185 [Monosporascus sp. CRB-8-3]|nr:hypothetical protein DL769_005185 [Monosporascus sp. CRB-8-3]